MFEAIWWKVVIFLHYMGYYFHSIFYSFLWRWICSAALFLIVLLYTDHQPITNMLCLHLTTSSMFVAHLSWDFKYMYSGETWYHVYIDYSCFHHDLALALTHWLLFDSKKIFMKIIMCIKRSKVLFRASVSSIAKTQQATTIFYMKWFRVISLHSGVFMRTTTYKSFSS